MSIDQLSIADITSLGFSNHRLAKAAELYVDKALGSSDVTNHVYGINHRQTPLAVPMNKDNYGLCFFTRPQLNFQSDNLRHKRFMMPLLTTEPLSYHRFIRCTLDPRLATGYGDDDINSSEGADGITCPLVDSRMAFIPVLTNSLTSISGWPDMKLPIAQSQEGKYKESHIMADGVTEDYSAYTLSATFRNSRGDPITSMFAYWAHYIGSVFEGSMVPYRDMIIERELDYCTRIYRLVLDPSKRKVQRIAACGAAIPSGVPTGGVFDFSTEKPYNDVNASINIPFQCTGFIFQDEILIRTFNETVIIFNPSMDVDSRDQEMVKIPFEYLTYFNNRGYPFIDPDTHELHWYVDAELYDAKMEVLKKFDSLLDQAIGFNLLQT